MPLDRMGWQRKRPRPLPKSGRPARKRWRLIGRSIEPRIVKWIPSSGTHRIDLLTIVPVSCFFGRQPRQVFLLKVQQAFLILLAALRFRDRWLTGRAASGTPEVDGSDPPVWTAWIGSAGWAHVHGHATPRRGSLPSHYPSLQEDVRTDQKPRPRRFRWQPPLRPNPPPLEARKRTPDRLRYSATD